jgi:hypothetical protein
MMDAVRPMKVDYCAFTRVFRNSKDQCVRLRLHRRDRALTITAADIVECALNAGGDECVSDFERLLWFGSYLLHVTDTQLTLWRPWGKKKVPVGSGVVTPTQYVRRLFICRHDIGLEYTCRVVRIGVPDVAHVLVRPTHCRMLSSVYIVTHRKQSWRVAWDWNWAVLERNFDNAPSCWTTEDEEMAWAVHIGKCLSDFMRVPLQLPA